MLNVFFGLLVLTADAQTGTASTTGQDCSQFLNCSMCTLANCTWFKDNICNSSKIDEPAQAGTANQMGNEQLLFTRNSSLCSFIGSVGNTQKPLDSTQQGGMTSSKPGRKGKKGKMGKMKGHVDIHIMEGEAGPNDCMGTDGDAMPFMRHGTRWQNPKTCALVMCANGKLRMMDCPHLACPDGNHTCDSANRCLPKPCDRGEDRRLAADLAPPVIPLVGTVVTPVVTPVVTTHVVTPVVTTQVVTPVVTSQLAVVLPLYADCLALGDTPALKHGQTWKNPTTCDTFQCFNGIITSLSCVSTICPNGDLRPCDPSNNCKPKECGADCPALGDFPFLRDNQTVYDPITCNRYTCKNRVTTRETCLTATCPNGELRPCLASNDCQPLACSTGTFLPPVVLPGTYVASVILPGTWLTPVVSTWATTTTMYVLPSAFSADCPAHGLFPFLHHGESWMDPLTCNTYSCNNGLATSASSCLRTLCPGGILAPCDPLNNCFSSICP